MCSDRGKTDVIHHSTLLRNLAIFDIQFHQSLRMLGYKREWHYEQAFAFHAGAPHLGFSRWPNPFQRSHSALIADLPLDQSWLKPFHNRSHRTLDLPLVRIAAV